MSRRTGFTLIEVIIVIVILGVLAALALPRITGNLQTVKGAEAMRFFGAIRRAYVDCMDMSDGSVNSCANMANLGVQAPAGAWHNYQSNTGVGFPDIAVFYATNAKSGDGYPMICMYIGSNGDMVTYDTCPLGNAYTSIVTRTGKAGTQGAPACCAWSV